MIEQRKLAKNILLGLGGITLGVMLGCDREQVADSPQLQEEIDPVYLEAASRQNDTGVLFSGNHPRTVNDTCLPGEIDHDDEWLMGEEFEQSHFFGQDCEVGRDATHADQTEAHGGFSFVKVSAEGEPLPHDSDVWACVLDEVTGLMWEAKVSSEDAQANGSLHNTDDVFSWYSTDASANGGNIGNWNRDRADCAGYQEGVPASFCNTQEFAERVNESALCGYSDWRVPSVMELTSIVNYGRTQPTIDTDYFPNIRQTAYWTSGVVAGSGDVARVIDFEFGLTRVGMRIDRNPVILVRSHQP